MGTMLVKARKEKDTTARAKRDHMDLTTIMSAKVRKERDITQDIMVQDTIQLAIIMVTATLGILMVIMQRVKERKGAMDHRTITDIRKNLRNIMGKVLNRRNLVGIRIMAV